MIHVILDPIKLQKYHELNTKVELAITKARLDLLNNKPEKGFIDLFVGEVAFDHLTLFVMITEQCCMATSKGALELVNKGIVKDIEVIPKK